jgi:flagellar motor switch protein FliG
MEMLNADKPLKIKMLKIQSKNARPMIMADMDNTMPIKLARLRFA